MSITKSDLRYYKRRVPFVQKVVENDSEINYKVEGESKELLSKSIKS